MIIKKYKKEKYVILIIGSLNNFSYNVSQFADYLLGNLSSKLLLNIISNNILNNISNILLKFNYYML